MKIRILTLMGLIILFSCSTSNDIPAPTPTPVSNVYVSSITLSGTDITTGNTTQLTANVFPTTATTKSLSWTSSDTSIATVSSSGLVTAVKNGTVIITATATDKNTVFSTKTVVITSIVNVPIYTYIVSNASEFLIAIGKVKAGETIFLNGGNYTFNSRINLTTSGTSASPITILGSTTGQRVRFDFSAMPLNSSNQGIILAANYLNIKAIDIYKAGDNGMEIKGNNNTIEFCTFSECSDTGLQIDNGASNNIILNCDSFFNADLLNENADGFAAKMGVGTGNQFIGCRAWQNSDDGWDGYLRGADNVSTSYSNCWSIKNGYLKDGTRSAGDGNGFKTGGSDLKDLRHNATYKNCISVNNFANGFDQNSNRGIVTIYNCSAYNNLKNNYFFSSGSNPLDKLIIKNSSVLGVFGSASNPVIIDVTNNSWQNGIVTDNNDFESLDTAQLISSRKLDGSLPDITFMHLKAGSDLIDKGVDVGLPFKGIAPDLGSFEY